MGDVTKVTKNSYTHVKVFSATMVKDRMQLGEVVSDWLATMRGGRERIYVKNTRISPWAVERPCLRKGVYDLFRTGVPAPMRTSRLSPKPGAIINPLRFDASENYIARARLVR